MNLTLDKENKTIHISEFNLTSEELIKLAKQYKEYNFKNSNNEFNYVEYESEDETSITFPSGTLLDYTSSTTCNCEDTKSCEKINKCKNLIN